MKCTNCGKEIDDIKIMMVLNIKMERKTSADTWENIQNGFLNPRETLCPDCFSVFADTLDQALNHIGSK